LNDFITESYVYEMQNNFVNIKKRRKKQLNINDAEIVFFDFGFN